MTGENFYKIHQDCAALFGENLPAWSDLSSDQRRGWEERAYEQELRDREAR